MGNGNTRGQSEVVGEILLVGITVVAVSVIGVWAVGYLGYLGGPTERTVVSFEETDSGVVLLAEHLSENASVRIEGEKVETIGPDDVGHRVFVPAAPGEVVTVVSTDGDREVLTADIVHRGESGDFVGYYRYDAGSGTTIDDGSENGNDATISGDPVWRSDDNGSYLEFDGTDDYATIDDASVTAIDDISQLTMAVKFRINGGTDDGPPDYKNNQQLLEHTPDGTSEEVYLETKGTGPFELLYSVNHNAGKTISTPGNPLESGTVYTTVATFDQDAGTYTLYLDGEQVASGTHSQPLDLGRFRIARDDEESLQHLNGRLYETRIYYTAFDEAEVERLTERMD